MKRRFIGIVCLTVMTSIAACDKDDDDDNNLSATDRNFITQASYANNSEISAGAVASVKGSDSTVRMYGAHMVSDHSMAQSELRSLVERWSITTPTMPDSMHLAMMKKMEPMQGRMFDTAYINSQVMDHNMAIALFQQEANNGENNRLRDYANKYLPHLMSHKKMADSIQAILK